MFELGCRQEPEKGADPALAAAASPKPAADATTETQTDDQVPDPDRATYDPFFFELIISNVDELLEWIHKFSDGASPARPRCELKLRDRLQALYDEAQPLAADQQQANQKIGQQLWKEWDVFQSQSGQGSSQDECASDNELRGSPALSASGQSEEEEEDNSVESNDWIRHSKRLRNRPAVARSASPADDEDAAPAKQSRRGSYHFDPGWDSDHDAEQQPGRNNRRTPKFSERMKNPHYWIGRRMTRAAAAYAGSEFPDEQVGGEATPETQPPPPPPPDKEEKSAQPKVRTEPLADQLRQLRRQQVLLSSNDPRPGSEKTPPTNGSPRSVLFPSKDAQGQITYVRITNPKAVELLSRIKQQQQQQQPSVPKPAPAPPVSEKKILIQIQEPGGGAPKSLDITHVIHEAVTKGLIVNHEPRSLSMDLGSHGQFIVGAQMSANGPVVLSVATAAPAAPKTNGVTSPAPPAAAKRSPAAAENRNSIIHPDVLTSIAGPDAQGARLSILKEGNNKVLTLILANGEIRRLTNSQVEMIQAAARNKKSSAASVAVAAAAVAVAAAPESS